MNTRRRNVVILCFVATAAVVTAWLLTRERQAPSEETPETEEGPVASVETAPVERKAVSEKVIAYGSVIAQPGKTHTVSVAFESRINHVLVAAGQLVGLDDPLLEIEASPATDLLLRQAQNTLEVAQRELTQTQERFNLKLATNQELNQAQKAARDAELQLQAFQQEGARSNGPLRAKTPGVVATVAAQDGQIAAAGSALVEIVASDEIEVKLGIEAQDAATFEAGQSIALFPVNQSSSNPVKGTVRLVTQRINPATRLVDVYVALPPSSGLLLDGYVRAEIEKSVKDALTVPRSAILPEEGAYTVFTIQDDHAIKHTVEIGLETDREVQINASDLREGDTVVTDGNYELEDGMAVEASE
jgi:membrane fusion protein, multidrug efflux system